MTDSRLRDSWLLFKSDVTEAFSDFKDELLSDGTDVHTSFLDYYRQNSWLQGLLQGAGLLVAVIVLDNLLRFPLAAKMAYVAPVTRATKQGGLLSGTVMTLACLCAVAHSDLAVLGSGEKLGGEAVLTVIVLVTAMLLSNQSESRLRKMADTAHTDPLTGAYNRMGFGMRAQSAIEDALASSGKASLALVDCDNFKHLNDRFGHAAGDAVLQTVVRSLRAIVPEDCFVGRLGGDEFVVIAPNRGKEPLNRWMETALERFQGYTHRMGFPAQFTWGISTTSDDVKTLDDLMKSADSTMYKSKGRMLVMLENVNGPTLSA